MADVRMHLPIHLPVWRHPPMAIMLQRLKMNYLEAVKDTGYVYGEAEVQRQGGRIGVYTVKLMDENQRVLVTADFTYYRTGQAIDQQG